MSEENKSEETMDSRFIDINGTKVLNLTPSFKGEMALVSKSVLDRLTESLETVSLHVIKNQLRGNISECNTLEEIVSVTEDFANFHNSVNLINEIKKEELEKLMREPDPKVIGKVDLSRPLEDRRK